MAAILMIAHQARVHRNCQKIHAEACLPPPMAVSLIHCARLSWHGYWAWHAGKCNLCELFKQVRAWLNDQENADPMVPQQPGHMIFLVCLTAGRGSPASELARRGLSSSESERESDADSESVLMLRVLQRRKLADSRRRFVGSLASPLLPSAVHSAMTASRTNHHVNKDS